MTAEEYKQSFRKNCISKNPRTNWKAEFKKERNNVLDEAIAKIRTEIRNVPKEWHRGYFSAITKLEIMKDDI